MFTACKAGAILSLAWAALAWPAASAAADDVGAIVRVTGVTSARLSVYERASNDSKLKEIDKEGVKLPLEVFDTADEDRFLKVKIDGDSFWVKKSQVAVLRAISAGCLAQTAAPVLGGGIRGGNRGCGK